MTQPRSNPRLQRTPLRAPLSRKPLGAPTHMRRTTLVALLGVAVSIFPACRHLISDYGFHAYGVVVDHDGTPIRGVRVTLEIPVAEYQPNPPIIHGLAYTDERGEFIFSYFAGGPIRLYSLRFDKDGYTTLAVEEAPLAASPHRIVLKAVGK